MNHAIELAIKSMPLVSALINKDSDALDFIIKNISTEGDDYEQELESYVFGLASFACVLIHSLAEIEEQDPSEVLQDFALLLSETN